MNNISDLGQLLRQFGKLGTKFEFWEIGEYSTPEGEDISIERGICVTNDSANGGAYAEWIFDNTGALEQFAVWNRPA